MQVLADDVSPPLSWAPGRAGLSQPTKQGHFWHAVVRHPGNMPQPFYPTLGDLGVQCFLVSPQVPHSCRGDVLLPLLISGCHQHGADAAMVKSIEPVQVFAHWGPAFTSIKEYRHHTCLVHFPLGGSGESAICEDGTA